MLGVIGGPLISASAIAVLFGAYEQDGLHALFSVPEGAFEPAFAISLIAKGFRPSPILDDARPLLAVWRTSGTIRLALGRRPGWGEIPREALEEAPAGALTPRTR
jgi:hypothetical protein